MLLRCQRTILGMARHPIDEPKSCVDDQDPKPVEIADIRLTEKSGKFLSIQVFHIQFFIGICDRKTFGDPAGVSSGSQAGTANRAPQLSPAPKAEKTAGWISGPAWPWRHSSAAMSSEADDVLP